MAIAVVAVLAGLVTVEHKNLDQSSADGATRAT
jgi:hypothetical protein